MRRFNTMAPYEAYKRVANSQVGFSGDQDFIDFLIPALREVEDDTIIQFLPSLIFQSQQVNFNAIEVCIIREYVCRVEKTEKEEAEARADLAALRLELQNDPAYTGIQRKNGNRNRNNV